MNIEYKIQRIVENTKHACLHSKDATNQILLLLEDQEKNNRLNLAWKVLERVGFTKGEEFTDDDVIEFISD